MVNCRQKAPGVTLQFMYVAIDTNAIPGGFRIESADVKALVRFLQETDSRLLLSEIVPIEIAARFKAECNDALRNLDSAYRRVKAFGIDLPSVENEQLLTEAISLHQKSIDTILPTSVVEQIPINGNFMEQVVHRLAERRKPASDKGEEFRDCVIWTDLLDYAERHPTNRPIVFIGKDKGFSGDGVSFHPDLQQELKDRGIEVDYYPSIRDFLAAQNVQVPEDFRSGTEVIVTSGSLLVRGIMGGPSFTFNGRNFSITGTGEQGSVSAARCFPCEANTRLNLNSLFAGNFGLGYGPAIIKDKRYDPVFYSGPIDFYGQTEVEVPFISDEGTQTVSLSGDFTFAGFMRGYPRNVMT